MESSRRLPFDRSKELNNLKKQRLSAIEEARRPAGNNTNLGLGFRANANDSIGFTQFDELVNQYKTALAELTFNSKPIITNLTIIAGENLQAARAIASTICSHIIEVPSEQKLPSLYLLDSIVKNIGRDYIKYFAARLPEVFCKAYRQVDPSIHSGMRHLFGTWKGVFPPLQLQGIEMELGFTTAVNGSSSGSAALKTDSQTQRQPHSIHVNPKFMDARRFQQESQPKETDINGVDVGSSEDVERTNRTILQKPRGAGYGDHDFASGVKRSFSSAAGKSIGQGNEKRWLGSSGEVEESISTQRNGFDVKRGMLNYKSGRTGSTDLPLLSNFPRSGIEASKSWKDSEEEDYRWDHMGNRATDPGAVDKLEFGTHSSKWQSQTVARPSIESPSELKEASFAEPRSSSPLVQQASTRSGVELSNFVSPAATASGAKASVGPRRPAPAKRDPRQSLIEKDFLKSQSLVQTNPREASLSGQSNIGIRDLPSRQQNIQPRNLQKTQSRIPQKPLSALSSEQTRYVPSSQQSSHVGAKLTGIVSKAQEMLGSSALKTVAQSGSSNPPLGVSCEESNVSTLLAAVMKSGSLSGQLGIQFPATTSASVKVETPPLPPGPSNSSTLVTNSSTHISKKVSGDSNTFSILSTLLSKGLISAPKTPGTTPVAAPDPPAPASAPILCEDQHSEQSPTALKSSVALPAVTNEETLSSVPSEKVPEILVPSTKAESEDLIGFEFKPRLLREFHPAVIDKLSVDLPHKCIACGLGFCLRERLAKHSEGHAFENSRSNCLNPPSRRWYPNTSDWLAGNAGFPFGYNSTCLPGESSRTGEDNEKMVPADESQCVCLLCGELFEDFYSQERDEWMFRGAAYIPNISGNSEAGPPYESGMHNMIVHCKCMSDDSVRELGLARGIKVEKKT